MTEEIHPLGINFIGVQEQGRGERAERSGG